MKTKSSRTASLKRSRASSKRQKQEIGDVQFTKKDDGQNIPGSVGTVLRKNAKCKQSDLKVRRKHVSRRKVAICTESDENKSIKMNTILSEDGETEKSLKHSLSSLAGNDQPASVSDALVKFLLSVKCLFKQSSLMSMMKIDIHYASESDAAFQPQAEDWPELQKSLLSLQTCLQNLQSLIDSEHAASATLAHPGALETDEPTSSGDVSAVDTAEDVAEAAVTWHAVAERVPSSPVPEEEEEAEDDPDWSPHEDGQEDQDHQQEEGEAEEEDTSAPTADVRRAARQTGRPHPFVCPSAGCETKLGVQRRFASEKSLRMHQVASHGQQASSRRYQEYTCPLCGSVQKRPCELATHIVACQGRGEARVPPASDLGDGAGSSDTSPFIMCRLCHLCFPTGDLLRAHCCQYADDGGVIQELLGTGTLSISGSELAALRRFICHQCREEFRNQAIYRVHLQFCRPGPYECELCGVQLPCGRRLVAHKMSEHRELNKPMFFCRASGCGLSFRLNAALQKHLVQRHSSRPTGQPYGCDVCDKKFIKKIYLTHHKLRYHHDTMQRDFVCDVCGARLGSSSALTVHVRSVHGRPEHTCDVCGKVFARQDRLAVHAKIHTGVKPFKCTLCPKAFIQQCKLNDHLRRHRGERRFRCVMCDKMYAASHDLRSHMRRIHNVDMVNKTHTIQPVASLLRPLPPPEPEPEPEPELEPEPVVQEPEAAEQQHHHHQQQQQQHLVSQTLQSVQLHSVQVAAPTQTVHVQDLSQLGGGLILIPAVDASGGTSFYPIINQ